MTILPVEAFNIDAAIGRMEVVNELRQSVDWVLHRAALHPCKGHLYIALGKTALVTKGSDTSRRIAVKPGGVCAC